MPNCVQYQVEAKISGPKRVDPVISTIHPHAKPPHRTPPRKPSMNWLKSGQCVSDWRRVFLHLVRLTRLRCLSTPIQDYIVSEQSVGTEVSSSCPEAASCWSFRCPDCWASTRKCNDLTYGRIKTCFSRRNVTESPPETSIAVSRKVPRDALSQCVTRV